MRVATYNLYGPANPDRSRRHRVSGAALRALDADVVALQEVPTDNGFLAEYLGSGWHVTPFGRASPEGVGGVLATRAPHGVVTEVDLHVNDRARDALPWTACLVVGAGDAARWTA